MTTVPFTFANLSGNIPLSALDANFDALANAVPELAQKAITVTQAQQPNITSVGDLTSLTVVNNLTAGPTTLTNLTVTGIVTANTITGTLATATQPNITTVGTLGALSVSGNITGSYIIGNGSQLTGITSTYANANVSAFLSDFGSNAISTTGNITCGNIIGTVATAAQPRITSVGNLTSLSVIGNVSAGLVVGTLSLGPQPNITAVGTLNSLSVTGNIIGPSISGTTLTGTLSTATQPNITALGTLNSLSVAGNIAGGNLAATNLTGTLITAAQPNITSLGILSILSVTGNVVAQNISGTNVTGTLTTAGQPNITSLGTLSSLSVAGNITGSYIFGNGSQLTGITTTATPGGANTTVQYNDAGTLGGSAAFTFNKTSNAMSVIGNISTSSYFIGNGSQLTGITSTATPGGANTTIQFNDNGSTGGSAAFTFNKASNVVSATGNISTSSFFIGNGSQLTGIVTSSNAALLTGNTLSSNVVNSSLTTVGTLSSLSVAGNITAGNIVGNGAGTPTVSSTVDLILSSPTAVRVSGGGSFRLPNLSQAQINSLSPATGDMVYNTTTGNVQVYRSSGWGNITIT